MANLMSLSTELHSMIIDHLDYFGLSNLQCTNRYFHELPNEKQQEKAFWGAVSLAAKIIRECSGEEKWPKKLGLPPSAR